MINRIKCNVCVLLTTAAVCFALGACSDEEGDSMPQVPANPNALCAITPHAVEINQVDASTTPITRSATGEPEQKATYAENLGHNFSAEATLEAEPQDAQTRAGANLAPDAQYRIVVYDGSGAIVGNVVYKQGSTTVVSGEVIKLKAGTYRLFAYTFNSASAIRELDADNKNVTVNSGEDFMTYTNTAFTISSTDYGSGKALNISFIRQCVRLTVRIVVEGYDGDNNIVTAASMKVGNVFGSGSNQWNGTTNTDASILPSVAGTASLTKASGNGSTVDCGPSADNPYLITFPFSNQTISISNFDFIAYGSAHPIRISFPNPVTFVKGGSYRLTIYTGNYYVLTEGVNNYVQMGDLTWARTNLQQTSTGITLVDYPWGLGSCWSWGMCDATAYGTNTYLSGSYASWNNSTIGHTNQDPCRSLSPYWHLPTYDELIYLANYKAPNGTKVRINGKVNTINSYGWAPDAKGTVFQFNKSVLFLPAAGNRTAAGVVSTPDEGGFYWCSRGDGDANAALAFYLDLKSFNKPAVYTGGRSTGMSLRCVQN